MDIAGLYILSYLIGAVPTAYLMGRIVKGVDIRGYGSGNVGGTNVFYHVGKKWGVIQGVLDILSKGALPVWVGIYVLGLDRYSLILLLAPVMALIGHNWSVFLKFQGGRGLAVGLGSLLALSPILLAAFFVVAIPGWLLTRSSGVWVLISLVLLPLWAALVNDPVVISYYCASLLGLTILKRLFSNWTPLPADRSKKKVLFNRLFRDRDVEDHAEWVHREPQSIK